MRKLLQKLTCSVIIPAIFFSGFFNAYATDALSILIGDLNKDGICSVSDIILLRTYIMDPEKMPQQDFETADINGDNVLTVSDVVALRKIIMSDAQPTQLIIEPDSCVLTVGDTLKFIAKLTKGELQSDVIWNTDNSEVAQVDENGVISALSPGQAIVTATYEELSCFVHITVCPNLTEGMYTIKSISGEQYLYVDSEDIAFGTLQNDDKYKFNIKPDGECIVLETQDGKFFELAKSEETESIVIGSNPQKFIPIKAQDNAYILKPSDNTESSVVFNIESGLMIGDYDPQNLDSHFVLNLIKDAVVFNTGGEGLNVRKGPGTQHEIVSAFVENARVVILSEALDGWYYVAGTDYSGKSVEGYCSGEFLKIIEKQESVLLCPVRRDGTSTVTQEYKPGTHNGIDIASYHGVHVDILAVAAGKVTGMSASCTHNHGKKLGQTFCYDDKYCNSNMGNYVRIDHGNGIITTYMHLTDVYVNVGDQVQAGQVIGTMGSTGRSTGVHLHFEIRVDNVRVEPREFIALPDRYVPIC